MDEDNSTNDIRFTRIKKLLDPKEEDHKKPHCDSHLTVDELPPRTYSNADHLPNSIGASHPLKTKSNTDP